MAPDVLQRNAEAERKGGLRVHHPEPHLALRTDVLGELPGDGIRELLDTGTARTEQFVQCVQIGPVAPVQNHQVQRPGRQQPDEDTPEPWMVPDQSVVLRIGVRNIRSVQHGPGRVVHN